MLEGILKRVFKVCGQEKEFDQAISKLDYEGKLWVASQLTDIVFTVVAKTKGYTVEDNKEELDKLSKTIYEDMVENFYKAYGKETLDKFFTQNEEEEEKGVQ